MIRSVNSSGWIFRFSKSCWIFFKNGQWWKSCDFFHSNSNCFTIDTHCILVRRIQPESFHLSFPSFYCFWSVSPVQHIERNQRRHILLASPIWSLEEQLCGFWIRVSSSDFVLLLPFWSRLRCLQKCTTETHWENLCCSHPHHWIILGRRRAFSKNCIRSRVVFYHVSLEHDTACLLL